MGIFGYPSTVLVLACLFCLTLLITALGFWRLTYFVSVGYAFSIVSMAIAVLLIFPQHGGLIAILHNLLLALWGVRLGFFLFRRERQSSFQQTARTVNGQYGNVSLPQKFVIWLGVSVLYVLMFLPNLYQSADYSIRASAWAILTQAAGLLLMVAGIITEGLADYQKSAFKRFSPQAFCNVGLYRWVRCPNYLGEILFWIGSWTMGLVFFTTPVRWIASLLGLLCLILIMLGSTRRLERSQERRYGDLPAYQEYVQTVPVLVPFVPVYTLQNIRVYLVSILKILLVVVYFADEVGKINNHKTILG